MMTRSSEHYIIRGGTPGRERLRLLSRVMHEATLALLDRVGVASGSTCLDVGCGGGDVTRELARRVGSQGRVVGEDIDAVKLEHARAEAAGCFEAEFRQADIYVGPLEPEFDLIYVRFLLTHLPQPGLALSRLVQRLRPGGRIVLADIDFAGHLCVPTHSAFWRYHDLHIRSMLRRGGNPNIGPLLPGMLLERGITDVGVQVVQPIGVTGEAKLIPAITMENIAQAILADELATRDELERLIAELYLLAKDERTLTGMPRVIETWGRRP